MQNVKNEKMKKTFKKTEGNPSLLSAIAGVTVCTIELVADYDTASVEALLGLTDAWVTPPASAKAKGPP